MCRSGFWWRPSADGNWHAKLIDENNSKGKPNRDCSPKEELDGESSLLPFEGMGHADRPVHDAHHLRRIQYHSGNISDRCQPWRAELHHFVSVQHQLANCRLQTSRRYSLVWYQRWNARWMTRRCPWLFILTIVNINSISGMGLKMHVGLAWAKFLVESNIFYYMKFTSILPRQRRNPQLFLSSFLRQKTVAARSFILPRGGGRGPHTSQSGYRLLPK